MLFNVCMSMPRAFATLFISRPKLLSSSIKSISSPVKGLCNLGQLWLHCGQVQRSIVRNWQFWSHFRLSDGITDRCGLVPLNMIVWLLPLTCLPPLRRPVKRIYTILIHSCIVSTNCVKRDFSFILKFIWSLMKFYINFYFIKLYVKQPETIQRMSTVFEQDSKHVYALLNCTFSSLVLLLLCVSLLLDPLSLLPLSPLAFVFFPSPFLVLLLLSRAEYCFPILHFANDRVNFFRFRRRSSVVFSFFDRGTISLSGTRTQ